MLFAKMGNIPMLKELESFKEGENGIEKNPGTV